MGRPPSHAEIFERAVAEGDRRLGQPLLELVSTSFIAGFTIVFGIVALGMVEAIVTPQGGRLGTLAGALAFGIGIMFLVAGKTELFNENFPEPAAAAVERSGSWLLGPLLRLWTFTLVFNLVGGGLFATLFAIEGSLPPGSGVALLETAESIVHRSVPATFVRAIAGGALVSIMAFLLAGIDAMGSRLFLAYVVGVLLALGPFEHVVVTVLHVYTGLLFGATAAAGPVALRLGVVAAGNVVGGLGLVTFTHVAQAVGAREA